MSAEGRPQDGHGGAQRPEDGDWDGEGAHNQDAQHGGVQRRGVAEHVDAGKRPVLDLHEVVDHPARRPGEQQRDQERGRHRAGKGRQPRGLATDQRRTG